MEPQPYLVAGPAVPETIQMRSTRRDMHSVGGFAGQVATALASARLPVTLLASLGQGQRSRDFRKTLQEHHITTVAANGRGGWAELRLSGTGRITSQRGYWPPLPDCNELAINLIRRARFLIISTQSQSAPVNRYLEQADQCGVPALLTARNTATAPTTLQITAPKAAVTMNHYEYASIRRASDSPTPEALMRALNTTAMLVTSGPDGWTLHRAGQPKLRSPAVPAPPHSSLVGCGDHAAAGLAQALAESLPDAEIRTLINQRISQQISRWHQPA